MLSDQGKEAGDFEQITKEKDKVNNLNIAQAH